MLGQRFRAGEVCLRRLQGCLLPLQRRRRRIHLRLKRFLVHLEEDLALLHDRAFRVDALVEEARHARLNVHGLRALGLSDHLGVDRGIVRRDDERRHFDGTAGDDLLLFFPARGQADRGGDPDNADGRDMARRSFSRHPSGSVIASLGRASAYGVCSGFALHCQSVMP